jgi:hypothetical protein
MRSDRRCTSNIELCIHLRAERPGVIVREAKVLRGESQLVDEMPYVGMVEVHELVDIGQVEEAARGRRLWCRERAAIDVLEG